MLRHNEQSSMVSEMPPQRLAADRPSHGAFDASLYGVPERVSRSQGPPDRLYGGMPLRGDPKTSANSYARYMLENYHPEQHKLFSKYSDRERTDETRAAKALYSRYRDSKFGTENKWEPFTPDEMSEKRSRTDAGDIARSRLSEDQRNDLQSYNRKRGKETTQKEKNAMAAYTKSLREVHREAKQKAQRLGTELEGESRQDGESSGAAPQDSGEERLPQGLNTTDWWNNQDAWRQ